MHRNIADSSRSTATWIWRRAPLPEVNAGCSHRMHDGGEDRRGRARPARQSKTDEHVFCSAEQASSEESNDAIRQISKHFDALRDSGLNLDSSSALREHWDAGVEHVEYSVVQSNGIFHDSGRSQNVSLCAKSIRPGVSKLVTAYRMAQADQLHDLSRRLPVPVLQFHSLAEVW